MYNVPVYLVQVSTDLISTEKFVMHKVTVTSPIERCYLESHVNFIQNSVITNLRILRIDFESTRGETLQYTHLLPKIVFIALAISIDIYYLKKLIST